MPEMLDTETLIAQAHTDATEAHGTESHAVESHAVDSHAGDDHGGGHHAYARPISHPPELPHFIQVWFELNKKNGKAENEYYDPYGDPNSEEGVNLVQGLHVGYLEEPVPFVNYAPWENNVFAIIGALFIVISAFVATSPFRKRSKEDIIKRPTRLQSAVELVTAGFDDFCQGVLGPENGRRYMPFVSAMFICILVFNLMGIVPLMRAPTSTLLFTASLALCTFVMYQWVAWTRLGPKNYILHLCGYPQNAIQLCLAPLMMVLEGISDFIAKPLSLALRLFGNILGKDILLGVMMLLGLMISGGILPTVGKWVGVPLTFPFYFLALLLSAIQALVFSLLSAIYILLVLPHDHDHGDEHH